MAKLTMTDIHEDGGTQSRTTLFLDTAEEYANAMVRFWPFQYQPVSVGRMFNYLIERPFGLFTCWSETVWIVAAAVIFRGHFGNDVR
jgi:hypothetical protein